MKKPPHDCKYFYANKRRRLGCLFHGFIWCRYTKQEDAERCMGYKSTIKCKGGGKHNGENAITETVH